MAFSRSATAAAAALAMCLACAPEPASSPCNDHNECRSGEVCRLGRCEAGLPAPARGDAGPLDAGLPDPIVPVEDAGRDENPDASAPDASAPDAAAPDTGLQDAGRADAGARCHLDTAWRDLDGDGYTSGAAEVEVCDDTGPPAGYLVARRPPPAVSFRARVIEEEPLGQGGVAWRNERHAGRADAQYAEVDDLAPTEPSRYLVLTDFALTLPEGASVLGVAVHVRRSATAGGVLDHTVRLVDGQTLLGESRASPATWSLTPEDVTYGGPADLWGAALTPALVTSPGFGVALKVSATAELDDEEARVDHVWLEVFVDVGEDCDDDAPGAYAARAFAADGDGDGWGVGAWSTLCVGSAVPPGVAELDGDCVDGDARVHPGQTSFFAADRGDGSWDYDCDGVETRTQVFDSAACACAALGTCWWSDGALREPSAPCGGTEVFDTCGGDCSVEMCAVITGGGSETIRCR